MKVRFIREIGTRVEIGRSWAGSCGQFGEHTARHHLGDFLAGNEYPKPSLSDDSLPWASTCERCGAVAPADADFRRFSTERRLYDTPTGEREPGSVYLAGWYPCAKGGPCIEGWSNCDGKHLICVLPNGYDWDINSRCSNCTRPDDKTHRCWVKHGDPEAGTLHVDKSGDTCAAGAGSIIADGWHGFLHNGELVQC